MPRPTLLIVDDDREVTRTLSEVLEAAGWKVLCEHDGDWALKTFQSRRIDAVVLDFLKPLRSGVGLADAIRSDPRGGRTPMVLLSGGHRGAQSRQEAVERYALLDCLNKPVEADHVCRLLTEARLGRSASPHKSSGPVSLRSARRAPGASGAPHQTGAQPLQAEPRVLPREPVALRGSLEDTPFPQLLHELYKLQATGALFMMRGSIKKIVYLSNGQPVFIKSNKLRECLGQLLVEQGRLTAEQAEDTYAQSRVDGELHGQVLLRQSLLTAPELTAALTDQLEVKLFEIFGWARGEYQFKENARIPAGELRLQTSCATLIVRGVARFNTSAQLELALAPARSAYPAPASDPFLRYQWLELEVVEEEVAQALDGTHTLAELLEDPGWERRQALQLIHALYCAGVVDLWDRALSLPPVRSVARRRELFGEGRLLRDDPQLEEHLAVELVKLKKWDHFRVLELERDADSQDVEAAFDRAAWRVHPDGFEGAPQPVRSLVEGLFNRLRAAYLVLRTPFRREGYCEQIARDGHGEEEDDALLLREARRHYEDGLSNLKKGQYERAAWHLRRAVALADRDASYCAHLGWAVHKNGPTDHVATKEARRHLERAIQLDPELDTPHIFFGHMYLAEDEPGSARACFEKALQLNPDSKEAAEQLKAL